VANQLNLSSEQIDQLNTITSEGTTNYVEGYRYITSIIEDNPNVDAATKFFFAGATQVNGNFSTDANIYIRGVTQAGLAWDGKLESDPDAREAQIQATSDAIAHNIILEITADGGIPQIGTILTNDANLAVTLHGQSIGG
jgi:hypothetical protein